MRDVTPQFVDFFEVCKAIWDGYFSKYELWHPKGDFEAVCDLLEEELFLKAAGARDRSQLVIADMNGSPFPEPECTYHSHGFSWGQENIEKWVVPGNLQPKEFCSVRILCRDDT